MEKIKKFIKNNIKTLLAFIIGGLVFGTGVYAVANIPSGSVTYTKNGQTTVDGALDALYAKAINCKNIKNNKVYFAFGSPTTSSATNYSSVGKNVFVALNGDQSSVCIILNSKLHCFDNHNYAIEKEHVLHVFSDSNCDPATSIPGYGTFINCRANGMQCTINSTGAIRCSDNGTGEYCSIGDDKIIACSKS